LHALEISPELTKIGKRLLDGSAHIDRVERFIESIGDELSQSEKQGIIQLFQQNREMFDGLPLVLAHGDLHGENFSFQRDAEGVEHITVMDLETLRVNNEFYDWATTANLGSFSSAIEQYGPVLPFEFKKRLEKSWIDNKSIELEVFIEQEIIAKDVRGKSAETAYRLMRIVHALEKLQAASGDDPLMILQRNAAVKIIRDQLFKLLQK
jgi:thiamine kinase-like enzyme